jgi:predicted kinase
MTQKTYQKVAGRGSEALVGGRSVVLDATSPTRAMRALLLGAGREAPRVLAWCRCPEATVLDRLRRRAAAGDDPSDAGAAVYLAMRDRFEPPAPAESAMISVDCRLDAWLGVEQVLGRLAAAAPIHSA